MKKLCLLVVILLMFSGCTTKESMQKTLNEYNSATDVTVSEYTKNKAVVDGYTDDLVLFLSRISVSDRLCDKLGNNMTKNDSQSTRFDKAKYVLPLDSVDILWSRYEDTGLGVTDLDGKHIWVFRSPVVRINECFTEYGSHALTQFIVLDGIEGYQMVCRVYWKDGNIVQIFRYYNKVEAN